MGFNYSPKIVTDGLVVYLDAANSRSYVSGSTAWNDLSRNRNNGTLTVSGSNAISASYSSTNNGNILFSGTGSYTYIANGYTNILKNNNNWSVSIWFKANDLNNIPVLLSTDIGQLDYFDLFLEVGINAIYFAAGGGSTSNYLQNISTPLQINNIYNIWYVKTGVTTGRVYINGNEISLSVVGTGLGSMPNLNADLRLGAFKQGSFFLNGNIYSTQIYNRALTASEIQQNYNTHKTRFGLT